MSATVSFARYVILVRHASRDLESHQDEAMQSMLGWREPVEGSQVDIEDNRDVKPDYEKGGLPRTRAIANKLANELHGDEIWITQAWHSPHLIACQTLEAYEWSLKSRVRSSLPKQVEYGLETRDPSLAQTLARKLENWAASESAEVNAAIVVVGHEPMLTHLARNLTSKKLPANTLPLGGSECACFEMGVRKVSL